MLSTIKKIFQPKISETAENSSRGIGVTLAELINLQNAARHINLTKTKNTMANFSGGYASRLRGRGIDFHEFRHYQAGDDIRHIDWRVTARTGAPHTKIFHEEKERPIFFVVDYSPSMFFATRVAYKSVIAAKVVALLSWAAMFNGDRVGAVVNSLNHHVEIPPQCRQKGILRLLNVLVSITAPKTFATPTNLLADALQRVTHLTKSGSLIIVVSDFSQFDSQCEKHLAHLSKHNEIIACAINDAIEITLPPRNIYSISDGNKFTTLNTNNRKYCEQFFQQFHQCRAQLISILNQLQIPLITLTTHENIIAVLTKFFAKAK